MILAISVNEILIFITIFLACLVILSALTIFVLRLLKIKKHVHNNDLNNSSPSDSRNTNLDMLLDFPDFTKSQQKQSSNRISESVVKFIFGELINSKVFIHYTREKSTADNILKAGFKYSDSIYKTTQEVINNPIDLTYKLQLYKPYGDYLIVISIPTYIFDFAEKNTRSYKQAILIDQVLSKYNPAEDLDYTLPATFIRGYVNVESNTIVENNAYLNDFNWEGYKPVIRNVLK